MNGLSRTDIVKVDKEELIKMLNAALADEWIAYHQYYLGSKIVTGVMRPVASEELMQHANDELRHAGMLSDRIIQLEGLPIGNPAQFAETANAPFLDPSYNRSVSSIIADAAQSERGAIEVYTNLLAFVKDKDVVTYDLILKILEDEVGHEFDFDTILEDLKQE